MEYSRLIARGTNNTREQRLFLPRDKIFTRGGRPDKPYKHENKVNKTDKTNKSDEKYKERPNRSAGRYGNRKPFRGTRTKTVTALDVDADGKEIKIPMTFYLEDS